MTDDLIQAFTGLLEQYGSHCQVAKHLGIAPDHYRKMRNGRVNIPQRTADYILLKAQEVAALSPPPQPGDPPGAEPMTAS